MKYKFFAAIAAFAIIFGATAYAGILGDVSNQWETDMGSYTKFHKTTFLSDSVGKQTESYIEYTPNSDAKPVVVNLSLIHI